MCPQAKHREIKRGGGGRGERDSSKPNFRETHRAEGKKGEKQNYNIKHCYLGFPKLRRFLYEESYLPR